MCYICIVMSCFFETVYSALPSYAATLVELKMWPHKRVAVGEG